MATTEYEHIIFEWDDHKAQLNLTKHGIGFDEAILVFFDEFVLQKQDRIENGEMRWQSLGMVANTIILLVAHTWYDDGQKEHIRIISARQATKKERHHYEQQITH